MQTCDQYDIIGEYVLDCAGRLARRATELRNGAWHTRWSTWIMEAVESGKHGIRWGGRLWGLALL
eukprot:10895094-Alexandrium_andersonii.AAC.1